MIDLTHDQKGAVDSQINETTDATSSNIYDLTSAVRTLRMQGIGLADICTNPQQLVDTLNTIDPNLFAITYTQHQSDSSSYFLAQELSANSSDRESWETKAPEWEIAALKGKLYDLYEWVTKISPQRLDVGLYQQSVTGLTNAVYSLGDAEGEEVSSLREEIRHHMTNSLFGLFLKTIPRFYRDRGTNEIVIDDNSRTWSPDYYRMAESNVLRRLAGVIEGKSVLDPFAGAGAFMNSLVAHGVPSEATYSDLCYSGGFAVNGHDVVYDPILNRQMTLQAFDGLPSWYKPPYDRIKGYVTADAGRIPFADYSFDLVVCDPPYGKTLPEGGVKFVMGFLPEIFRVCREGVVFMVPTKWLPEFDEIGVNYTDFTGDPSYGESGYPICYIYLPKPNLT